MKAAVCSERGKSRTTADKNEKVTETDTAAFNGKIKCENCFQCL